MMLYPGLCLPPWHSPGHEANLKQQTHNMSKPIQTLSEIIRNPKHTFRKADDRPVKAQKHRYERRKIKEFIKYGDWSEENAS